MVITSIADITGNNAVHAIGTATQQARALLLTAIGGVARFGDANVTATQGVELPEGVEVTIRASEADRTDYIQLGQVYAYVPDGTTLTIACGL
jgi:hypothetical protein